VLVEGQKEEAERSLTSLDDKKVISSTTVAVGRLTPRGNESLQPAISRTPVYLDEEMLSLKRSVFRFWSFIYVTHIG